MLTFVSVAPKGGPSDRLHGTCAIQQAHFMKGEERMAEGEGFFDKVKGVFHDEKSTDEALDKVAGAANKVTGGRFEEKVESVRDAADKHLGTE